MDERAENPYRQRMGMTPQDDALAFGPRQRVSGPGLLGADIDRIARHHHFMGREEALGEARQREMQMREQIAEAFDEGASAQDELNTKMVWNTVRQRLLADVSFPLLEILHGPKRALPERLPELCDAVDRILADISLILERHEG